MICLWYVELLQLCFKREDQLIEWMTKGQAMTPSINFFGTMESPILWEKTGPIHLVLLGLTAGRQAGRRNTAGLCNVENPLQVKIFIFCFVYSSAMSLIVLKVYFSLFSQTKCILWCVLWCVIFGHHFFTSIPTVRY